MPRSLLRTFLFKAAENVINSEFSLGCPLDWENREMTVTLFFDREISRREIYSIQGGRWTGKPRNDWEFYIFLEEKSIRSLEISYILYLMI